MNQLRWIVLVGGVLWPCALQTAPLDEFLTATPGFAPLHGEGEVGVNMMNNQIDVLGIREGKTDPRNSAIGDYSGVHMRGGLALSRRLWLDGGALVRKITTPYDSGESVSLHGAAQFLVLQPLGWFPAMALRLSAWGDSASEAVKGSPSSITLGGTTVTADKVRVEQPWDEQVQLDLISTWHLTPSTRLSMFASYGKSSVYFDNLYVTTISANGLTATGQFLLKQTNTSGSTGIKGTCVSDCGQVLDFTMPAPADMQVPEGLNIGYDSDYYQVGGMYGWMSPQWRARLGYRYIKLNRDVDQAVTDMGKTVIDSNHFLTGEVGYKPPFPLFEHAGLFVRGQVMMNQFVGEIPFSYNAFSSHKFDNRYGLITAGVTGGF